MERDMENKNILPANPGDAVPELKILCQKAVDLIDRARNTAIREVNLVQLLTYYTLGKWIVEVQEGGTILTLKKVIPTRLVRNGFCRTVEEAESRGADAEELSALIGRGRPKRGIFEGDLDEGELEIGQIAALIEDLPPAGEILRRLVAEYEAARGSLGPL